MVIQIGSSSAIIRISIGNIGIIIEADSEAMGERIRPAYRQFSNEVDMNIVIKITSNDSQAKSPYEASHLFFDEQWIHFDDNHLSGSINYLTGRGQLSVTSSFLEASIDYALRIITAVLAVKAGGLLFHAVGIAHHGSGCLFFGPSESGKTTIARLSPNDIVLNDDLVLLRKQGNRWMIYATPFTNPGQIKPTCSSVPLTAMFRLVKDRSTYIEPMSQAQALAEFVANIPVITGNAIFAQDLLVLSENLIRVIPSRRLHFLLDDSFWELVESVL
jgi:hypothetical protein